MILRSYPVGWGVGEKLSSGQMNAIDTSLTYALDKRTGQVDTFGSVVTASSPGRLIASVLTASDADLGIDGSTHRNFIRFSSAVLSNRTVTLGTTSTGANDIMTVYCDADFTKEVTVKDQAGVTLAVLGNTIYSDSSWGTFVYVGGGWRVLSGGVGTKTRSATFTATGQTALIPKGILLAIMSGFGGGGGGGTGYRNGIPATDRWQSGGGGGGGAWQSTQFVALLDAAGYGGTPTLTCTNLGAGGVGGANVLMAGAGSNVGQPGGDTTISDNLGVVATFKGGQGGQGGYYVDGATGYAYVYGGQPQSDCSASYPYTAGVLGNIPELVTSPQLGGFGVTSNIPVGRGGGSPQGFAGGTLASNAAVSPGSYRAGGGGGSGGGGPGGGGGAGGNGGNGNNSTGGPNNGNAGGFAAANTGAGGGGGGGPGQGNAVDGGSGAALAGGNGGSGRVRVVFVR